MTEYGFTNEGTRVHPDAIWLPSSEANTQTQETAAAFQEMLTQSERWRLDRFLFLPLPSKTSFKFLFSGDPPADATFFGLPWFIRLLTGDERKFLNLPKIFRPSTVTAPQPESYQRRRISPTFIPEVILRAQEFSTDVLPKGWKVMRLKAAPFIKSLHGIKYEKPHQFLGEVVLNEEESHFDPLQEVLEMVNAEVFESMPLAIRRRTTIKTV